MRVTTHGQEPLLPSSEILDPKNVKQYYPPLEHTNVTTIKVRSTANSKLDHNEVWSCTFCESVIGSLRMTKEHIADCHGYMIQNHNDGTKMMHYLAAHAEKSGQTVCHMPDWNRMECGMTMSGDILVHLVEAHDLWEDDLLANEETGNIWIKIAEVNRDLRTERDSGMV